MMENDDEIIEYYAQSRNLKFETKRNYRIYIKQYAEYFNTTIKQLLDEAETEEETGVRWKHRTLKKRLIEYRIHLYNTFAPSTAKSRFTKIQAFYRHFDIEIHPLPPFSTKNLDKVAPTKFTDLPDKEVIRAAVDIATPVQKCLILFMSSSGCGRAETLNLTVSDYIKATEQYHHGGSIKEIIETIDKIEDVVPTFDILRVKTNKYYTTFCSPEAVKMINNYLLTRNNLKLDDPLFKINDTYFIEAFEIINDKLNLGKVGHYRRFRSHMMRKYHASTLMNDGMSKDLANTLQGKSQSLTDESYFLTDIDSLKMEYVKHLPALMVSKEVEKVTVKSPEFLELESENRVLQDKNRELDDKVRRIFERLDVLEDSVSWDDAKKEY